MSNNNYNLEEVPGEFKKYVKYVHGSYAVKNDRNSVLITFARFGSLDMACAAAKLLIKFDWNIKYVNDDPLIEYNNQFWVFKVLNNRLIFDSKFDSFDSAVEYCEINLRCNDFHNDIFRSSPKKNGYKNRFKGSENQNDDEVDTKYIFEKSDKFIIKRSKRKGNHCYGEFDSFEQARVARKLLLDNNWRLSDGNEIILFDGSYWVFEVLDLVLTYKGNSKSYDDALDIVNPPSLNKKYENPYLKSVFENFDKVTAKPKRKPYSKKKNKSKLPKNNNESGKGDKKIFRKEHVNIRRNPVIFNKIWEPFVNSDKLKCGCYKFIIVESTIYEDKLAAFFEIRVHENYVGYDVDGVEIPSNTNANFVLEGFPEFGLIKEILENNQWDIYKISQSSSIYYYNYQYYRVQVINDDTIIFRKFGDYNSAEKNSIIYKGRALGKFKPHDIDKVGRKFELVKFQIGKVLKIAPLKSLEEIKAVRDILIHINWNVDELKKYDIFYLNGLYWELEYSDHVVSLICRYESVKII